MMSKKKPKGHEKGWLGSIPNWLNGEKKKEKNSVLLNKKD